MVLLRGGKVVKLADSGLAWNERFSFYDQVHTTGMDIKQTVDACAALTLGKDMVFRDYAQGAFRMRGIGRGQTIRLICVPEIMERIATHVAIGKGETRSNDNLLLDEGQFLKDVVSWLNINSMRVDSIQFNLLSEQSVANIWRKRAFANLRSDFRYIDAKEVPRGLAQSLQLFRERIDFDIENSVPVSQPYSEKIRKAITDHQNMLSTDADMAAANRIFSIVKEEESLTGAIKTQVKIMGNAAADAIDSAGGASEQSFNREQVQEQEQEQEQEHEQEKEKEKEEERVEELEAEEYTKQNYSRDDEEPKPWLVEDLGHGVQIKQDKLGFFPLSKFAIFQNVVRENDTLNFPEYLWVSKNHFDIKWSMSRTTRRIKNVVCILEIDPHQKNMLPEHLVQTPQLEGSSFAAGSFTPEQESHLLRIFSLADLDRDGRIDYNDYLRIINNMGIDVNTANVTLQKYDAKIAAQGFTYGVFREIFADLESQYRKQGDRYYVLLSLEEAEHLRGILHSRDTSFDNLILGRTPVFWAQLAWPSGS